MKLTIRKQLQIICIKSLLAILLFCISQSAQAQEYPIYITEEGHIILEVALNDTIKSNFILDTGAGITIVSPKTYNKIKNQSIEEGVFTGFRHDGDRIDGIVYSTKSISIGKTSYENFKFGIYPPLDDYGIDGLVSLKFFEDKPFSIDYVNQKIRFLSNDEAIGLSEKYLTLPLSIDKVKDISLDMSISICLNSDLSIDAQFDTGSGYGMYIINPFYMDKLGLDKSNASIQQYQTPVSHKNLIDSVFTMSEIGLCIDSQELTQSNVSVNFREDMIYEGLIGSRLFKDKVITIDLPRKVFIVH